MDKYNFNCEEIRIIDVSFSLKEPESKSDIEVVPSFEFNHKLAGKNLEVYLGISFDHPAAPFKFKVVAFGKFGFPVDTSTISNGIDKIAIINCSAIIFPFLRENIAELTRKAGYPPMILPPVNFVSIYHEMQETKQINE